MLESDTILLRPIVTEDAVSVYDYSRDPEVLKYTKASTPAKLSDTQSFINSISRPSEGEYYFAICEKPQVICEGIIDFSISGNLGSIHYGLSKRLWGRGIATHCVRLVIEWAIGQFPAMKTVTSSVFQVNTASHKVLLKNGFSVVGSHEISKQGRVFVENDYILNIGESPN